MGELLGRSTKQKSYISLFIFATQTDHGQTMGRQWADHGQTMGRQWADEGLYIEFKQGAESGLGTVPAIQVQRRGGTIRVACVNIRKSSRSIYISNFLACLQAEG